jgi:hypothetical protein
MFPGSLALLPSQGAPALNYFFETFLIYHNDTQKGLRSPPMSVPLCPFQKRVTLGLCLQATR